MYAEVSFLKKGIYIIPVIPVYFIILTVSHSFVKYYFYDKYGFHLLKMIVSLIFFICSTMVIICHLLAMMISPGYVEEGWKPTKEVNPKSPYAKSLFCRRCTNPRPERAHHCKICRKCVLKMDHHCPWIANCVGYYNQKYFYLFLFYATIGDFIAFIILLSKLVEMDFNVKGDKVANSFSDLLYFMWDPLIVILATIMSFSMTLAIGILFFVQTKLILNNMTTIESHVFTTSDPWGYNNKYHNFKILMGEKIYEWFLPIFKKNVYNGGDTFTFPNEMTDKEVIHKYLNLGDIENQEQSVSSGVRENN